MEEAGEAALEVEKEEAAKAKGGEKEGQAAVGDPLSARGYNHQLNTQIALYF